MEVSRRVALPAAVPRIPGASAHWGLSQRVHVTRDMLLCWPQELPQRWETPRGVGAAVHVPPAVFEPGPGVPLPHGPGGWPGAFPHPNNTALATKYALGMARTRASIREALEIQTTACLSGCWKSW